jgi:hypothetical protein
MKHFDIVAEFDAENQSSPFSHILLSVTEARVYRLSLGLQPLNPETANTNSEATATILISNLPVSQGGNYIALETATASSSSNSPSGAGGIVMVFLPANAVINLIVTSQGLNPLFNVMAVVEELS